MRSYHCYHCHAVKIMNEAQAMAQLKAAAFQLAAILGCREAANRVERVAGEVRHLEWPDRQHGGS